MAPKRVLFQAHFLPIPLDLVLNFFFFSFIIIFLTTLLLDVLKIKECTVLVIIFFTFFCWHKHRLLHTLKKGINILLKVKHSPITRNKSTHPTLKYEHFRAGHSRDRVESTRKALPLVAYSSWPGVCSRVFKNGSRTLH